MFHVREGPLIAGDVPRLREEGRALHVLATAREFVYPSDVEGYSSEAECRQLYELACGVSEERVIVELGTYKGRSAIAMAQSGHRVWTFDRFQAESYFFNPLPDHREGKFSRHDVEQNASRYGVDVLAIERDTKEAGRSVAAIWGARGARPIGLLFIDAGHEYEDVKADTDAWLPLVADDGVVVFDDSLWPGVMRLLTELDDWTPIPGPQAGGLTALRRIRNG